MDLHVEACRLVKGQGLGKPRLESNSLDLRHFHLAKKLKKKTETLCHFAAFFSIFWFL